MFNFMCMCSLVWRMANEFGQVLQGLAGLEISGPLPEIEKKGHFPINPEWSVIFIDYGLFLS